MSVVPFLSNLLHVCAEVYITAICCTITNLHTYIQLEAYKWKIIHLKTYLVSAKGAICNAISWLLVQKCGQKSSIYPQKLTRCLTSNQPPPVSKKKQIGTSHGELRHCRDFAGYRLNISEDPMCFRSLVYTVTRTWSKIKVFKLNTVLNPFTVWCSITCRFRWINEHL